jgi:hypothetical protein
LRVNYEGHDYAADGGANNNDDDDDLMMMMTHTMMMMLMRACMLVMMTMMNGQGQARANYGQAFKGKGTPRQLGTGSGRSSLGSG